MDILNILGFALSAAVPLVAVAIAWGALSVRVQGVQAKADSLELALQKGNDRVGKLENVAVQGESEHRSLMDNFDALLENVNVHNSRLNTLERDGAEFRAEMKALVSGLARIDVKLDTASAEMQSIRRDVTILLERNKLSGGQ